MGFGKKNFNLGTCPTSYIVCGSGDTNFNVQVGYPITFNRKDMVAPGGTYTPTN